MARRLRIGIVRKEVRKQGHKIKSRRRATVLSRPEDANAPPSARHPLGARAGYWVGAVLPGHPLTNNTAQSAFKLVNGR